MENFIKHNVKKSLLKWAAVKKITMKKKILKEIDRRIRVLRIQHSIVTDIEETKATRLAAQSYIEERETLQSIRKFINKLK